MNLFKGCLPVGRTKRLLWLYASGAMCGCVGALAAEGGSLASAIAYKQMTLQELMEVEVTSVSKNPESYQTAPAALTVLTAEHIRRSGATTVPEALRGVPGIFVGRQDSNVWAVSSRGFSSVTSEKLLVLSDTRSIYTPLFSGVVWNVQDYLMADIDRIEVIRGPGATLWGSNAVNGVINIVTKNAADTHGTLVETTVGTEERVTGAVRYGGETRGGVHYRVFGKYAERDDSFHASPSSDEWRLGHLGFRADWSSAVEDEFTLQGDIYDATIGQLAPTVEVIGRAEAERNFERRATGGNILGRWVRRLSESSNVQFRAYYDHTVSDDTSFRDQLDTIDFDFQHRFAPGAGHELSWGLNQRTTINRNQSKGVFRVRPESSTDYLYSGFVQDQIAITDKVKVTLGTKIEHNDFSGFELQPGVRAAWDIDDKHTLWAAVSRAARIPTRSERDVFVDASDPAGDPVYRLVGNRDFDSEELTAYELGYRWRASEDLHFDLAVFANDYEGLASLELGEVFADPDGRTVIPILNQNLTDGQMQGGEALFIYAPLERWRLSGRYSYLALQLEPSGLDVNRGEFYEDATPRHQFSLSSYLTLPGGVELDMHFRRVGVIRRLPTNPDGTGIPAYSELDIHVSWQVSPRVRLSVVGKNLLDERHLEFGSPTARGEIERGVYAKLAWEL